MRMADKNHKTSYVLEQYRTPCNLHARKHLYTFTVRKLDLIAFAFDALTLTGQENILDAGCGDGAALVKLRNERKHSGTLIGIDISAGMLTEAKAGQRTILGQPLYFVIGTADSLPF